MQKVGSLLQPGLPDEGVEILRTRLQITVFWELSLGKRE